MEKLLTIDEVADLLGVPRSTLYQWRYRGEGPPVTKIGKHLRYAPSSVDRWVAEHTQGAA